MVLSGHSSNLPENFNFLHFSKVEPQCSWANTQIQTIKYGLTKLHHPDEVASPYVTKLHTG